MYSEFKDADVRKMSLKELCPADYNPRQISEKAFSGLGVSLDRFGLLEPIIWNERTGNIVGGHQRHKHLVESGEEETDVVVVSLDPSEEVALNITLNNKEARGKFTAEAVGLLQRTEAALGSVFQELRLVDLHKVLASKIKPPDSGPITPVIKEPSGDSGIDDIGPQAVITCPKCKSRWRMSDNRVVFKGSTKDEQ